MLQAPPWSRRSSLTLRGSPSASPESPVSPPDCDRSGHRSRRSARNRRRGLRCPRRRSCRHRRSSPESTSVVRRRVAGVAGVAAVARVAACSHHRLVAAAALARTPRGPVPAAVAVAECEGVAVSPVFASVRVARVDFGVGDCVAGVAGVAAITELAVGIDAGFDVALPVLPAVPVAGAVELPVSPEIAIPSAVAVASPVSPEFAVGGRVAGVTRPRVASQASPQSANANSLRRPGVSGLRLPLSHRSRPSRLRLGFAFASPELPVSPDRQRRRNRVSG